MQFLKKTDCQGQHGFVCISLVTACFETLKPAELECPFLCLIVAGAGDSCDQKLTRDVVEGISLSEGFYKAD